MDPLVLPSHILIIVVREVYLSEQVKPSRLHDTQTFDEPNVWSNGLYIVPISHRLAINPVYLNSGR